MKAVESKALSLEIVAKHFQEWRSKKNKGERIPDRLWLESIALLSDYSLNRVARTLHLCGTDLKKRQHALSAPSGSRLAGSPEMTFVEIDHTLLVDAATRRNAVLELERPDGVRLRIQPQNAADTLALLDHFLRV
jgi:hypothetical protein